MWLKFFLYFLSFPSLFYMRWDFCKQFLHLFFFLSIIYNLLEIVLAHQRWLVPYFDRPIPEYHPSFLFIHPIFLFIYLDDYFPIGAIFNEYNPPSAFSSITDADPSDTIVYFILGGFALFIMNYLYSAFRDKYLPEITSRHIPILFSGASWFAYPCRMFMLPARIHRLALEPIFLIAIGLYLWLYFQPALGILVIINAFFYFLASLLDLNDYRDSYLKESRINIPKSKGWLNFKKEKITTNNESIIVTVCHSSNNINAPIPVNEICSHMSSDYKHLIDINSNRPA